MTTPDTSHPLAQRGFATAWVMVRISATATPKQLREIAADLIAEAEQMEARK